MQPWSPTTGGGGGLAGRLVWMLRVIGQPAALLDGGLGAWDGTPRERTGRRRARRSRRAPVAGRTQSADADAVAEHIRAGGMVIDSREPARYAGEVEPIDAVAGHIPGAINLLYTDNLDDRAALS